MTHTVVVEGVWLLLAMFGAAALGSRFVLLFRRTLQEKSLMRRKLLRARAYLADQKCSARGLQREKLLCDIVRRICAIPQAHENPSVDGWHGVVGFFHPFCNHGGGGERVLWAAVETIQRRWPKVVCVIYTGDIEADKGTILERVQSRFNIRLRTSGVFFVYLSRRWYILDSTYPHFTLLGQSFGSVVLVMEAFIRLIPDIFIDTMGFAFASAFCRVMFPQVTTGAYVHYPTISTDMLRSLLHGSASSLSRLRAAMKERYWSLFAKLYAWAGSQVDVVVCNSSWTRDHLDQLWTPSRKHLPHTSASVLYPPVNVWELSQSIDISLENEQVTREPWLLYIAQFRPEKNHELIIKAFHLLLQKWKGGFSRSWRGSKPRLVLVGSLRDGTRDDVHVNRLRLLTIKLGIDGRTDFVCNATWRQVLDYLSRSSIGVNGMWNEHFGICVVEYQAAGLISVTHKSGGPKQDIVIDFEEGPTGFHAKTEQEFAAAFEEALSLSEREMLAMRKRSRISSQRFTREKFQKQWEVEMQKLIGLQLRYV